MGIDASTEMIAQARANFPQLDFRAGDATSFQLTDPVDAVFSNAVLHWVKDQAGALRCIHCALKPGGRFVAELGGKGNIETIVSAAGANPWYFPGIADYSTMLETQGLEVRFATLFDRPTRIEGENGLKDWLEMFGACAHHGSQGASRARQTAAVLRWRLDTGLQEVAGGCGEKIIEYCLLRADCVSVPNSKYGAFPILFWRTIRYHGARFTALSERSHVGWRRVCGPVLRISVDLGDFGG